MSNDLVHFHIFSSIDFDDLGSCITVTLKTSPLVQLVQFLQEVRLAQEHPGQRNRDKIR